VDSDYMTPALERWRHWTDLPLVVLAVGSLPLLLLDLRRTELTYADRVFIDVVNVLILVAFAIDYLVELLVARNRMRYVRSEWISPLLVVSQALALVPTLAGFGVLRVLRGARAVSVIARVVALGGIATREGRAVLRKHAAGLALGLAGFTWVTSAVAFTLAEDVGVDGRVHSFGDALWWSAATITTVGYGDVAPITFVGRAVGVFTMVVGISTFAVITAKAAEFLVRADRLDREPNSID
jgi:voltage-gated potassium channel